MGDPGLMVVILLAAQADLVVVVATVQLWE
jgi:hypothetical protein